MPTHHRTVRFVTVFASAVLFLLASCSHPSAGASVGIVYRGGPAPGNSDALRPGTIRIFSSDGGLAAAGHVGDGHGHVLHASLPPGSYRVEAHSGDAGCAPRTIVVQSGRQTSIRILCQIK